MKTLLLLLFLFFAASASADSWSSFSFNCRVYPLNDPGRCGRPDPQSADDSVLVITKAIGLPPPRPYVLAETTMVARPARISRSYQVPASDTLRLHGVIAEVLRPGMAGGPVLIPARCPPQARYVRATPKRSP